VFHADGDFGPNTARAIAKHYDLKPERAAHLLGQASHESGGFKLTRENLNYSAEVMCRVWPNRFKSLEAAAPFARNPKALAEKTYFGRMGKRHERKGQSLHRQRFRPINWIR
jgi:putative chitinase